MKSSIIAGCFLLASSVAFAAPIKTEVAKTSSLPISVKANLSKGSESKFFGKVPSQFTQGKRLWLHFYAVKSNRKAPEETKILFNPNDYFLDLWQQKTANSSLQRLCSTKLNGSEFTISPLFEGQKFRSIEAGAMWLRDRNQQTPIIKIKTIWGNGFNADIYSFDSLFVFTQGWARSPVVQQFEGYSQLSTSVNYSFDQTDERDILLVTRRTDNNESVEVSDGDYVTTALRWNGSAFVPNADMSAAALP